MEKHLQEASIEALAHDRPELLSDGEHAHFAGCEHCQQEVEAARLLSEGVGDALFTWAPSELELRMLVRDALKDAEQSVEAAPSPKQMVASFGVSVNT